MGRGRILVPKSIMRIPTTDLSDALPEWHGFTRTQLTHYIEFLEHIIEEQGQDIERLRERFTPDTVLQDSIAFCPQCYREFDAKWFHCSDCGVDLVPKDTAMTNTNYRGI